MPMTFPNSLRSQFSRLSPQDRIPLPAYPISMRAEVDLELLVSPIH